MRSSSRLGIAAVVALVLLAANVLLAFYNTRRLCTDANWVEHTHQVIAGLEEILSLAKDAETGGRGFIITNDESYLEPYKQANSTIEAKLAEVERLTADNPVQQARFPELRMRIAKRMEILDGVIALSRNSGFAAARESMMSDRGKIVMDSVREHVAEMIRHERGKLVEREARSDRTFWTAVTTGLLSGLTAMIAILVGFVLVRRHNAAERASSEVIAEQAERLRTTLSSIGDGVITTDIDGLVTNLNPVAESLTGWKTSDAVGVSLEKVFSIVNETTRQKVTNPAIRALSEGIIVGLANHTVLISKDCTERPIDDSAAPIRCKDGEIVGCVLVFHDVSDKRAQEDLYRLALDSAGLGAWHVDPGTMKLTADSRFWEIFGTGSEGVDYASAVGTIHAEDQGRVQAAVEAAIRLDSPEPYAIEYRVVHPDGNIRWVYAKGRANFGGGVLKSFDGTIADITDRKLSQDALFESEQRLGQLADAMPQIVWAATPDGVLDYYNQQWFDYIDLPNDQIEAAQWDRYIHPDDLALAYEKWTDSIKSGKPYKIEFRVRGADGIYRWFLARALPVRSSDCDIIRWFGTCTDINEEKETADELRNVAARLSEADSRKNEFLAMLAHELRNPLAPIRNALHIMRMTSGNDSPIRSASEMMERQVGQLVRLVDDLLDVSRITRGKIELRREKVELASIIYQAVEVARPSCETGGVILDVKQPEAPIYLNGDSARLNQAVGNLLNNACKFTDEGGRIDLSVVEENGSAVIKVKDTGIGIAPEQRPFIFDMFVQADTSLERAVSGLGIGLTLVKNLVEMHDGSVSAASDGLGKGSEFTIRIPVLKPETATKEPLRVFETEISTMGKLRILVVDDNVDSAESLALLLEFSGHVAAMAHDGRAAVDMATSFDPEVILLDIGLPKLNGYEAARLIRELPNGNAINLIALTGWGQQEDRDRSKEAGFDGHMVKPVDHIELMKWLEKISAEKEGN